jgi:hypothetical protein
MRNEFSITGGIEEVMIRGMLKAWSDLLTREWVNGAEGQETTQILLVGDSVILV